MTHGADHFGFLAGAIAGRKITVQWATKSGDLAYSDGQSIFLPPVPQDQDADLWAAVAAQAALIGAGSLNASLLNQLLARPFLARRYLYLEMLRAARLLADRLPWAFTERPELRTAPLSDSAYESLKVAATPRELPEPPAYFGRILPFLGVRTAIGGEGLAALSRTVQQGQSTTREVAELDEDDPGESSTLLRLFQNPFSTGNPLSDLLNGILGAGLSKKHRDSASGEHGGVELPVGRVKRALKRGIHAVLSKLPAIMPDVDMAAASPAFTYPEWDVHTKAYRRAWVALEETEAWREDGPQDLGLLFGPAPAELRRQLIGLGVDQEMHRRQTDGSDLDLGALIDCAIELRAGHSPPNLQVYRTSRRMRRDLGVVLMVDISGSTGEQAPNGDSVFKKQLTVAYQLGQSLDALGDTVAMFGFHSWGRKLVRVVRIKGHAERWSLKVEQRMTLLEPLGYTRIGAAIRHGTHLLHDAIRLPNRLLLLITDGLAYDQDYELRYAAGDASRALAEARAAGTACVCLSVGAGTDTPKLMEVFGAANVLAVDEVGQVIARIRNVCKHALASASQRRWGGEVRLQRSSR